ncbi:MAG: exo-alpha-sialidase [Phycisphaeraceae bacterium]|nr:exo-alpha-sialidase [Phycisphaeraceae bacterium]
MNPAQFLHIALLGLTIPFTVEGQTTLFNGVTVPGVVIAHEPPTIKCFIGSPSIAILPNGDYVASHDLFGRDSGSETDDNISRVYRSTDRGQTWSLAATLRGQHWSNLFVLDGALYILGPSKHHGDMVIRRSTDGGITWTEPTDSKSGRLRSTGDAFGFHTSSVPVVIHAGRIWRAYEKHGGGEKWPHGYQAVVMSAAIDSDLLNADSWTHTNTLSHNSDWLPDSGFGGWLEGNVVVDPDGNIVNVLRVQVSEGQPEWVAIARVHGTESLTFDPVNDLIPFNGGSKKFNIRFHEGSGKYWSLVNLINEQNHNPEMMPARIRNIVALVSSSDLRQWAVDRIVIQDLSDVKKIGFQYLDWLPDGADIIAVSRTAYPDGSGEADNYHNANFLTFHRIPGVFQSEQTPSP